MAKTPFTPENYEFSMMAHKSARVRIYPFIFGTMKLKYKDEFGTHKDYHKAIDVTITAPQGKFSVQERFRRMDFANYRELTITTKSHFSGSTGEINKLWDCDLFVYGYCDPHGLFNEAVCLDVQKFRNALSFGNIEPKDSFYVKKKRQSVVGFCFDELRKKKLLVWHSLFPNETTMEL